MVIKWWLRKILSKYTQIRHKPVYPQHTYHNSQASPTPKLCLSIPQPRPTHHNQSPYSSPLYKLLCSLYSLRYNLRYSLRYNK